jgi:hypothetical protein
MTYQNHAHHIENSCALNNLQCLNKCGNQNKLSKNDMLSHLLGDSCDKKTFWCKLCRANVDNDMVTSHRCYNNSIHSYIQREIEIIKKTISKNKDFLSLTTKQILNEAILEEIKEEEEN